MSDTIMFGSGSAFIKDSTGKAYEFGAVQDASCEITSERVVARGKGRFPIDVAAAASSCKGKLKFLSIDLNIVKQVLGGTLTTGHVELVENETFAIPATPYEQTVVAAADLREILVLKIAGVPATPVASNPTAGQYIVDVATGKLTFAAADTGKTVVTSYTKDVAADGQTLAITNVDQGETVDVKLVLNTKYKGRILTYEFNKVSMDKLAFALALSAHTTQDVDWEAYADASGNVASISLK